MESLVMMALVFGPAFLIFGFIDYGRKKMEEKDKAMKFDTIKTDENIYYDKISYIFNSIKGYFTSKNPSFLDFDMSQEVRSYFNALERLRNESNKKVVTNVQFNGFSIKEIKIRDVESISEGYRIMATCICKGRVWNEADSVISPYKNNIELQDFEMKLSALVFGKYTHMTNCTSCGGVMDENNECVYCGEKFELDKGLKVISFGITEEYAWREKGLRIEII